MRPRFTYWKPERASFGIHCWNHTELPLRMWYHIDENLWAVTDQTHYPHGIGPELGTSRLEGRAGFVEAAVRGCVVFAERRYEQFHERHHSLRRYFHHFERWAQPKEGAANGR